MKRIVTVLALACMAACSKSPRVVLDYTLPDSLAPADVVSVKTIVMVGSGDARVFTADQASRSVEQGVLYEVSTDDNGVRSLIITQDSTLGYAFKKTFSFTLLPPVGSSPPLVISATAYGQSATVAIAHVDGVTAKFSSNGRAALTLTDDRCGGVTCGSAAVCCGNATCVDTTGDTANCGGCGTQCGTTGNSCSDGKCRCNGGSACTTGTMCCAGVGCIDTTSDPFNCGGCGVACNAGETCSAGMCACGTGTACAKDVACCNGSCATAANTGCPCGAATCDKGMPLCCNNADCVDTSTDKAHCGDCATTCGTMEACAGGHCLCGVGSNATECASGDTCCGDTGCKKLADDKLNCGACGKACGDGEICDGGSCKCGTGAACTAGSTCCGSGTTATCIDPTKDNDNCGACGRVCGQDTTCGNVGTSAAPIYDCVCAGTTAACTTGQTCCPGSGCYDLANSTTNCGACSKNGDHACATGQNCNAGKCVQGTACTPACGTGFTCTGGSCLCGGVTCAAGQSCCGNKCADTTSDPQNCGGCGQPVTASQLCCASKPTPRDGTNCNACNAGCFLSTCTKCTNDYECIGLFGSCAN